jgi:hypothetical protein
MDATQTRGHADQHLEEQVSLGVAMGFPEAQFRKALKPHQLVADVRRDTRSIAN